MRSDQQNTPACKNEDIIVHSGIYIYVGNMCLCNYWSQPAATSPRNNGILLLLPFSGCYATSRNWNDFKQWGKRDPVGSIVYVKAKPPRPPTGTARLVIQQPKSRLKLV